MQPLQLNQLFPSNIGVSIKKTKAEKTSLISKIGHVAKNILIAGVGIALFVTNSTVFAIGFVVGIIWDKATERVVNKIKAIWNKQPWAVLIVSGIGAFLALEVAMAAGTFLYGANLGSKISLRSQEMSKGNDPGPFNII